MRELVLTEIEAISAGNDANYSGWDVILISGLSSGISFGVIGGLASASVIEGMKYMVACTLPTAAVSTVLILGFVLRGA